MKNPTTLLILYTISLLLFLIASLTDNITNLILLTNLICLSAAAIIDLRTSEIPDEISYAMIGANLIFSLLLSYSTHNSWIALSAIGSGIILFIPAYLLSRLADFGGGDVKLLTGIGIAIGLLWNPFALLGYMFNLGILCIPYYGLYVLIYKSDKVRAAPLIALAFVITLLCGNLLIVFISEATKPPVYCITENLCTSNLTLLDQWTYLYGLRSSSISASQLASLENFSPVNLSL
jgi:Flp pilus assembly protein protease CpaA